MWVQGDQSHASRSAYPSFAHPQTVTQTKVKSFSFDILPQQKDKGKKDTIPRYLYNGKHSVESYNSSTVIDDRYFPEQGAYESIS